MNAERRLVVATRSEHKLEELRALLRLPDLQLLSLADMGVEEEAIEDAATFRGNAILKARFYGRLAELPTLADDSGLEVDALGGQPGVRTKRYAGESATDAENNALLLAELGDLPPDRRTARYRCVLAFLDRRDPNASERPRVVVRTGSFEGRIAAYARGTGGFGYDPLFEPRSEPPGGRTVAEMSVEEKNRRSHRARAARAMARYLR
ncbi:MAG: non-canonical purine NTP pyrophosphatase [Chloroflexota bacterium]|nr:non-canonical purine NTP pyrophosphatase [Chloroflexota bacterium]